RAPPREDRVASWTPRQGGRLHGMGPRGSSLPMLPAPGTPLQSRHARASRPDSWVGRSQPMASNAVEEVAGLFVIWLGIEGQRTVPLRFGEAVLLLLDEGQAV